MQYIAYLALIGAAYAQDTTAAASPVYYDETASVAVGIEGEVEHTAEEVDQLIDSEVTVSAEDPTDASYDANVKIYWRNSALESAFQALGQQVESTEHSADFRQVTRAME
jgi:hypothetical protein